MIDCHKCEHYYVTWDEHFPHGCKAMKFKSKQLPSVSVFVSSDIECLLYKIKSTFRGKKAESGHKEGALRPARSSKTKKQIP
jgi:hypothetical protein